LANIIVIRLRKVQHYRNELSVPTSGCIWNIPA